MGKLSYYIARLLSKMKPNAVRGCRIDKTANIGHGNQLVNCTVGRYTYIGDGSSLSSASIGAFCSIAPGCSIGGASHPLDFVSTSPVFLSGRNVLKKHLACIPYEPFKPVVIGNDVWLGSKCLVKQGVTIGDGAVIGMGSVVTKNVGPYEIWAGNPARLIRKRFDEETIQRFLTLGWWNLSDEELQRYGDCFNDPQRMLDAYEK